MRSMTVRSKSSDNEQIDYDGSVLAGWKRDTTDV